ncbi:MAG: substrate-binding periplasmic protein, partial [Gemmataceae bacterium]
MTRRWWILVLGGTALLGAGLYWHFSRTTLVSELRWGGDASGGEPYLIEKRQGQPAGFEGELAQYFAKELGFPPRFVQRDWAQLPQDLSRRDVDLILNGYEWFPAREDVMTSTIPYFAYRLRLIVRRDSPLKGWDDLRRQPGKPRIRVGVLRDSAAQRYLEHHFAGEVEVEGYDQEGVTGVMLKVGDGSLPATVQDGPAANWYLRQPEFSSLHAVGEPLKPTAFNYYVGYVRKEDRDLKTRLYGAIRKGLQDGTIRTIFEKYGVWDEDQANLLEAGKDWPPQELAERPSRMWFFWNLVLAAGMT